MWCQHIIIAIDSMNRIIRFALSNRVLVLLLAMVMMAWGLFTAGNTEVDVFPDLNAPTVVVMTEAGGMAAEEVEQLVTMPIETSVNGSTGVRRVRSQSTNGFSVVWVEFDWDTDIYIDRQIVSEKISTIAEQLPEGVASPVLGPQSSIMGEVMIVSLTTTGKATSMQDLRTIADWQVRPRLLSMGGVAQVSVQGGDIKEYQIVLNPDRMKHCGVTLKQVMDATRGMNDNQNGGVIYEYGNEYIVRAITQTNDVQKLSQCLVLKDGEKRVKLADIAEIRIGSQSPRLGVASERAHPAVLLTVTKQPNVSTLQLTENLDKALEELKETMPEDVHVSTDIFRQADFIEKSIDNVSDALLEGVVFVVIILFIFLANVRTTVISLVSIPLSLLVTVIILDLLGISINTMTLGGLAIAIGSLVDDAIVDVENVYKRLQTGQMTEGKLRVIYEASMEVRMPILYSTLIIIASFTPLFFLSGMEGRMLIPLGVAFIIALLASTLVALTVTPVLCSFLLRQAKEAEGTEPLLVRVLKRYYERALHWVMSHARATMAAVAALSALAVAVCCIMGSSFLPGFNEGSFTINISSLPGISLEESDSIGMRAERLLLQIPEIHTVARKTGRAELDEHTFGVNVSEIEAPFVLAGRSRDELMNDIRQRLSVLQGANVEIGQPISHRLDHMLSGTKASIAMKLYGHDLNRMFALGNQIKEAVEDVEGIADLSVEQQIERPELQIIPRRQLLAEAGISMPELNELLSVYLAGEVVSRVSEGGRNFNLVVKAGEDKRGRIEDLGDLIIDTQEGRKVPLSDVCEIRSTSAPNVISRENCQRLIVVSANTSGRDVGSVVSDIRERVGEHVTLPDGYRLEYGGQFESKERASRILSAATVLAVIVIYLLLFMQFRKAGEACAILLNLPLALVGGVFAIWMTTGEISIPAVIGFISLFGIATRNGMLLITEYNRLRLAGGLSLDEAIRQGSLSRMNPIIMTALTSALALVPLALGGELPGNEIQSPMAKVILGGLLSSTILNAFIVPIIYKWLNTRKA